jgi:SAM-dependent methyltransferase
MGSDYLFSKQCRLAGVQIFLDCGLICRHRWEGEYDITNHWDWLAKYGGNYEEEKFFGDRPAFTPFDSTSIYWGPAGPPVDINITSTGNVYHAENHVAPILGGRLEDITVETKPPTGVGYVIGWHVDSEEMWQKYSAWAARFSTVFVHWVGSDILNIPKWMDSPEKVAHMNHPRFIHFVEEDRLVAELKPYFEDIHVCPIPTMSAFPVAPLPKKFSVAVYYPKHRHDFHYGDVMEEVVKAMPDTQFNFYHLFGEKPDFEYPNLNWLGSLEPQKYHEMLKDSSCMLRLSRHDGRPFSIIEAAIMGRRFVTNFDMPFSNRVSDVPEVGEVVDMLRKIEKEQEPDTVAAEHYTKENDFKVYKDKIRSLMGAPVTAIGGYEYRPYWEGRWNDDTAGVKPDPETNKFVNQKILETIAEHSCQSILDLGCGSMKRWDELPVESDNYVGVDVSAKAVRMAAKKYPEGTFFVADITSDTLPQKDLVIATEVLPHIKPEHFKNTIKKIAKCAKKAAIFSLTFDSKGGGYQNEVPPVDEWRLGKGWNAKRIETPTASTIELVILTKESVLVKAEE